MVTYLFENISGLFTSGRAREQNIWSMIYVNMNKYVSEKGLRRWQRDEKKIDTVLKEKWRVKRVKPELYVPLAHHLSICIME